MKHPKKHKKLQRLKKMDQVDPYTSPWPLSTRLLIILWRIAWCFCFRPIPRLLRSWHLFLLKLFGCKISGKPYVDPSAWIKMPWNLTIEDLVCLAPQSEVYCLGKVILRARCTIAQQAYLCAGTHDFSNQNMPLIVGSIEIGEDAFIGARAFILPGVKIGKGAIVGACSVVTSDVEPYTVVAGNPAKFIKKREIKGP